MQPPLSFLFTCLLLFSVNASQAVDDKSTVKGWIFDETSGKAMSARLYIESESGEFYLAKPADALGRAITYDRKRSKFSLEKHTCLSAHPFEATLPPGKYTFTAERGHEYLTTSVEVEVELGQTTEIELRVPRWINMNERGWFSGETHCHRDLTEMTLLMEAEDLNVTFPLTAWVTDTAHSPANPEENKKKPSEDGLKPAGMAINLGENRIMWPMNTEYEIFSVDGAKHTLGAFFVLNHKKPIEDLVPPVGPVFERMTEEGALIEMDKHNWPWTLMLPTVLKKNGLFELSNNHVWRTHFGIRDWYPQMMGDYMAIPATDDGSGYDEEGWLSFGFQTYYALLNSGFKLRPTAGTGSGIHPVPLGFSRVYVKPAEGNFSYENWVTGLREGNSFVTTGPMLSITVAEKPLGSELDDEAANKLDDNEVEVIGAIESPFPIERLEIIVNGKPTEVETGGPIGSKAPHSAFVREQVKLEGESWVAFRAFARTEEGRIRFAHTSPVWIDAKGKSLLPSVLEAKYLRDRMTEEITRNTNVLSEEALAEFKTAEKYYEDLLQKAAKAN